MAKIGKDSIIVNGEWVQIELHYSRKPGFSAKGIPDKVLSLVEIKTKSSENEFMAHLRGKLEEYHEKTKKESKVILIDIAFGMDHVFRESTNNSRSGKGGIWSGVEHLRREYGFAFEWDVCKKIEAKETEYYSIQIDRDGLELFSRIHATIVSKRKEIPYTKEREEFFINMSESVGNMAEKICKFITSDNLPFLIDSKQRLLS